MSGQDSQTTNTDNKRDNYITEQRVWDAELARELEIEKRQRGYDPNIANQLEIEKKK